MGSDAIPIPSDGPPRLTGLYSAGNTWMVSGELGACNVARYTGDVMPAGVRRPVTVGQIEGRAHGFLLLFFASLLGSCGAERRSAPPVRLTLQTDLGDEISATQFRGRTLIFHVFTTWSMPAQDDAVRLQEAFGDDHRVAIVGVALDPEAPTLIGAWKRGTGIEYPISFADAAVRNGTSPLGETRAVPITVVFDKEGRLVLRYAIPLGREGILKIRERAGLNEGS